ncbi:MAG: efflux RND transporter periplasmic adaptor subunit, partial [Thermoanaerobaculia bacterium]
SSITKPQQPDVTFFEVKALFDRPDEELRPGMSVRAEIGTATHAGALVVPIQSVVDRPPLNAEGRPKEDAEEIKVVFVVEDGKAAQRPVTTGLSDETHVEILSGLKAGEQVIAGPYRSLRDLQAGDAVRISETSEAEDRRAGRDRGDEESEEED